MTASALASVPKTQRAWTLLEQGGDPILDRNYPVPSPGEGQVLVKVLYTGVCQSAPWPFNAPGRATASLQRRWLMLADLHTARGTATGPDGRPITAIKLPHVGGHEGVGRIIAFGPSASSVAATAQDLQLNTLVGIRFLASVCHACEYCLSGREQHCVSSRNHLHHIDGSFQEYTVLDRAYLTVLPQDVDPRVIGPVLCAGLTTFKAIKNAGLTQGDWLCVIGAGGGLGHLAVQYGLAQGANVIGVDAGEAKKRFVEGLGARFVDFSRTADLVGAVRDVVFNAAAAAAGDDGGGEKREQQQQQQQGGVTAAARSDGGCHAVVVTSGHPAAFTHAAELLRVGGTLCCVGIPPGEVRLSTPVASIVIRGLKIVGNLVGSLAETLEAVEYVRSGQVQVHVEVRPFEELVEAYAALESGDVPGRVVLEVARDE